MPPFKNFVLSFALIGAFLVSLLAPPTVHAQTSARTVTTLVTSSTSFTTSNSALTCTSSSFFIKAGAGFAVMPTFTLGAAPSSCTVSLAFQVSPDNVTWTTNSPLVAVVAPTVSTASTLFYNFAGTGITGTASADNVGYARLATITLNNNAGPITLSSVIVTHNN